MKEYSHQSSIIVFNTEGHELDSLCRFFSLKKLKIRNAYTVRSSPACWSLWLLDTTWGRQAGHTTESAFKYHSLCLLWMAYTIFADHPQWKATHWSDFIAACEILCFILKVDQSGQEYLNTVDLNDKCSSKVFKVICYSIFIDKQDKYQGKREVAANIIHNKDAPFTTEVQCICCSL